MNVLFSRFLVMNPFMEGGPLFMSLILLCLLLSVFFIIKGFLNRKRDEALSRRMLKLTIDSSLLGLVLGFLGAVIGLITAFDSIQSMGDMDPGVFAGGLKVSLLTATFGLFSFVISRIGILLLRAFFKD
ncbi:MotA/TolQ/ExbB proton channel family protein [Lacinutrix jangbogonensis]|uniref:MotA/TolQ/ExbB proton channel family protein n=1 Tax=Lacinutrix jangbogonensis TaxID=1469557 RepID=UPI00053D8BE2|nr:MotA/TolQ/ExbB proton channel family protein [Lacinutrix jangbogonensis]